MKKILFHCLSILLLQSCKKYGNGYVEGTVYEKGNNQVVTGATVSILKNTQVVYFKGIHFHQTVKSEYIESTTTDMNGKYKLYLNKNIGHKYVIVCRTETGYSRSAWLPIKNKKTKMDVYLNPYKYLRIRIKKNSVSVLKRIDINISFYPSQKVSISALNQLDTILPSVYQLVGYSDNYIDWYVSTPYPIPESSTWFSDVIYPTNDTLEKTFIID